MTRLRNIGPEGHILAIGHLLFAGLFVLASIHHVERCIHVDSANQIFKWVQLDGVEVEAYRFAAIFPQLIVKVVRLFSVDLNTLLWVASVAHVLVPYIIFVLTAHVFRTPWIAAGCALAAVLCTRLTFYGIVLEANYLLCYPFLLAGVIHGPLRKGATAGTLLILALALFLVLAVHPVGFLVALFVIVLLWPRLPEQRTILVILGSVTVLWGGLARFLLPPSGYESGLYTAAAEGLDQVHRVSKLPSFDFLVGHTWHYTTHYLPLWALLVVLSVLLIRRRDIRVLAITWAGVVGYTALNVFTYHAGETAMMMEKNFLPLATLVALPLLLAVGDLRSRWQSWAAVAFLAVSFIQFRGISFASKPARERVMKIGALVSEVRARGVRKAVVLERTLDEGGLHIHWALAFETMLYSAREGAESCVTVISSTDPPVIPPGKNVELSPFDARFNASDLDKRYFQLPETAYVLIPDLDAGHLR
ncbi:MAG: hypothetical protein R2815_02390 [Flavobacteriales bacterium]